MKKKDRKDLADKIALGIAIALKDKDEHAARKIRKHIVEASKELVKRFARHIPEREPKVEASKGTAVGQNSDQVSTGRTVKKRRIVSVKKRAVPKKGLKRVPRK